MAMLKCKNCGLLFSASDEGTPRVCWTCYREGHR